MPPQLLESGMGEYHLVAYWINGLGEECSSRVRSEFTDNGVSYFVVYDWRRRVLVVKPTTDFKEWRQELCH